MRLGCTKNNLLHEMNLQQKAKNT